jgi:hypothetical protein
LAAPITGDLTGRTWLFEPGRSISFNRWQATAEDDGSEAMIVLREKGGPWQREVDWMRRAIEVARIPEVTLAPTIRRFLDLRETQDETMRIGDEDQTFHGSLWSMWEWADVSLHDYVNAPGDDVSDVATDVERNVSEALRLLHGVGYVHCDVAPNNILRVDGVWKLADLDACRRQDEYADRYPREERYRHPDLHDDRPVALAREEFDWHGLEQVVRELRELSGV